MKEDYLDNMKDKQEIKNKFYNVLSNKTNFKIKNIVKIWFHCCKFKELGGYHFLAGRKDFILN